MTGESYRFLDGAAFILDAPEHVPAVWGDGQRVAWSAGEPCLIVGPPGVGKTTLAQQVVLARTGIADSQQVLGMTVTPDSERPTAYLAADRPRQAARSFRRMVAVDRPRVRQDLAERLLIWAGPLLTDLVDDPAHLAAWLQIHNVGTVVVDSIKDIASPLSADEVGNAVNAAFQRCVVAGIEVLALHHQRKAQGDNKKPTTLADVYGSTWITAGAGSVLGLWGDAGDSVVELRHLKQPAEDIGPLEVVHDHAAGTSRVEDQVDVYALVQQATNGGTTVQDVARRLFHTAEPTRNQVEKARRQLAGLVKREVATEIPGDRTTPTRYRPVALAAVAA